MRYFAYVTSLVLVGSPIAASAQTSNCQWLGAVWSCSQTPAPRPLDFGTLMSPADVGSSVMQGFRQGAEDRQRADQARFEAERIRAQTELLRAQTEAARAQIAPVNSPPATTQAPPWFLNWFEAVASRRTLFADFGAIVLGEGSPITPDLMVLMTSSPLAADIAYYLCTHRAEATAISQMPLLDAARAIDKIEAELRAKAPAGP